MALNGLFCADVSLRNYSLTHSLTGQAGHHPSCLWHAVSMTPAEPSDVSQTPAEPSDISDHGEPAYIRLCRTDIKSKLCICFIINLQHLL